MYIRYANNIFFFRRSPISILHPSPQNPLASEHEEGEMEEKENMRKNNDPYGTNHKTMLCIGCDRLAPYRAIASCTMTNDDETKN